MDTDCLLLRHAALGRPSGEWNGDDSDVLSDAEVVAAIL
jgi:hypothetical protein